MKKILLFTVILIVFSLSVKAQTANVTAGCSPLEVNFTGPDGLSNYYWEFVEGNASSTLQNPEHIFTHPGTYLVKLYEGQGNNEVGQIEIKIYNDPVITITADTLKGCTPLEVQFQSEISLDPELSIESYTWTFGDGLFSNDENPTHTYSASGTFNVSLEIKTNLTECNTILTLEDFISTDVLNVKFLANKYSFCEAPAKVRFVNQTEDQPGYSYHWDFDNGEFSTEFNPDSVSYFIEGNYTITLTVTSQDGCVNSKQRTITIGKPEIKIDPPQVACLEQEIYLINNTYASYYKWYFGDGSSIDSSELKSPSLLYLTPGNKSITFIAIASADCTIDTTFNILIEDPDASLVVDPTVSCFDPQQINLWANQKGYKTYNWWEGTSHFSIPQGEESSFIYDDKNRDSLYLHKLDSIWIYLEVVTEHGCKSLDSNLFIQYKPNAHFKPDIAQGCAPLTVNFTDLSTSREDIIRWSFDYSNGDSYETGTTPDHEYIFNDPGEYYVKMIIENEVGCIDTSAGLWIKVGEPIEPQFMLDKTEICLGESITVEFTNNDPRIDAFHLDTDDGRFVQCWTEKTATHAFNTLPGEYSVTAVTEYNGCYSESVANYQIKVNGAKADIGYLIDCASPYEVVFTSKSSNASKLEWTIQDTLLIKEEEFVHTFLERGNYDIILEAMDESSACPSSLDTQRVYIRDIQAKINISDKVCDNAIYVIDGSNSQDVDNDCAKGFLWYTPGRRPWETWHDTIQSIFYRGKNEVWLVVEDLNGCQDTAYQEVTGYGIEPTIAVDKESICFPTEVQTSNFTFSDTTIVRWEWQNGSEEKSPLISILDSISDLPYYDFQMVAEDALGCTDTAWIRLDIYEPFTQIYLNPDINLCVGDELLFYATDYNQEDSHLNFDWDFAPFGQYEGKDHTVVMNEKGSYSLTLNYEEESSGCGGVLDTTIFVVDTPIADFVSDVDGIFTICHPRIIEFTDYSKFDSLGYVRWTIGDITFANPYASSQTIELPKGLHEVKLEAISLFGCADTLVRYFELVGPEGEVSTDKTEVCIGDEVTFTLFNTVDVNDYEWDFGDGSTIANTNPIKHKYDRDVESFDAKIILKSTATGCNTSIDIPLSVKEIIADFEILDVENSCPGEIFINNLSTGANQYSWDVQEGSIEYLGDTVNVFYSVPGEYSIQLIASSTENACVDTLSQDVEVFELNDLVLFPTIFTPNNDGENDVFRPVVTSDNDLFEINITTFKVYNRWGNLVYDNKQPEGWNGDFNNERAPAGVYGYYIEFDISGCQFFKQQGNITLIR